ncbi:hypothetical protein GWI33_021375 [Rhynchophorus ferrugineus]|uniref:Uncharacterized protein n=1 Tax=Rhynchophorus ferrugineus TaxID=354439 RepID=A0A834I1F4_RHYFE|nr:hypothetical protein GWI33_021375 [Rhynchophorus ferrugineus]
MFFMCCGRRAVFEDNESPKQNVAVEAHQNNIATDTKQLESQMSSKPELILQPNFGRIRGVSTSSSARSIQSFYSCKSLGDEDYFSICSDISDQK